jgi:hypothetical protein
MLIDVADKMAPGWTFRSWTGYKLNDEHSEIEIEEKMALPVSAYPALEERGHAGHS